MVFDTSVHNSRMMQSGSSIKAEDVGCGRDSMCLITVSSGISKKRHFNKCLPIFCTLQ